MLKDMWGTKEYFAPELINQAYGPQADVWALGCVLFEMLTGEQAFPVREHDTEGKFYGRIQRGEYHKDIPQYKKISSEAKELIQNMLQVDPLVRWSASECLVHPWITGKIHSERHSQPLTDAQAAIRHRIERRKKKH
jgi:calcium-dependent protein kinase